jgi:hypothetical protein
MRMRSEAMRGGTHSDATNYPHVRSMQLHHRASQRDAMRSVALRTSLILVEDAEVPDASEQRNTMNQSDR